MDNLQESVKEWQEARRAIFDYTFKKDPDEEQLALWERLANAEHALMNIRTKP